MADKYLALVAGKKKEIEATVTSGGVANAGDIPALDSGGHLSATVMPSGIGPEAVTITAAEAISQWDLINIYLDGATLKGRKADGGTNKYVAHAYAPAAIDSAAEGTVYSDGWITGVGLTPGADYYLDNVAGAYCLAAAIPASTGEIVQKIGYAVSATQLVFAPEAEIELA